MCVFIYRESNYQPGGGRGRVPSQALHYSIPLKCVTCNKFWCHTFRCLVTSNDMTILQKAIQSLAQCSCLCSTVPQTRLQCEKIECLFKVGN